MHSIPCSSVSPSVSNPNPNPTLSNYFHIYSAHRSQCQRVYYSFNAWLFLMPHFGIKTIIINQKWYPCHIQMTTLGLLKRERWKAEHKCKADKLQVSSSIMNYLLLKCQQEIKDLRAAYFSSLFWRTIIYCLSLFLKHSLHVNILKGYFSFFSTFLHIFSPWSENQYSMQARQTMCPGGTDSIDC